MPIDLVYEGLFHSTQAAQQVKAWADQLGLKLNAGKTQEIFFGPSGYVQRLRAMNLPGVRLETGISIPFLNEIKSLEVVLDSKLSWRPQVNSVTKKVNRALYVLKYIKSCSTEVVRGRLVMDLVVPHLDYFTVVYLDASIDLPTRLQRLSNF